MKFDLKTPCKDCPFIKGSSTNKTLAEDRIEGIVDDIRAGMTFTCHKTLQKHTSEQQHCAGALIFLEKENKPNQMMKIAERLGLYDHRKLKMNVEIIDEY
ncbi:hypothetical protein D5F11_021600 [Siminovitchia terrae]|uniref:Uncharacterized protein n=1 Tax=Siminovitchia terrae TaxID=1914933 RepID=A0A429X2R7_SIMTE|nr:hypothetical protein [Siminovitchia terrae]RST57658.1 hypothetical protein D5F11_021600 [Siminovitchia terrae]